MSKRRTLLLRILDATAIVIFIATFTPLVIPQHKFHPMLAGIPYSMWMGFLVSIAFVVLTYLVSLINKEDTSAH